MRGDYKRREREWMSEESGGEKVRKSQGCEMRSAEKLRESKR